MMASFVALVEVCFLLLDSMVVCNWHEFIHFLISSSSSLEIAWFFWPFQINNAFEKYLWYNWQYIWHDLLFLPCPMSNAVLRCVYCYIQICKCNSAAALYSQSWCWLAGNVKLAYVCNMKYVTHSCMVVEDLIC